MLSYLLSFDRITYSFLKTKKRKLLLNKLHSMLLPNPHQTRARPHPTPLDPCQTPLDPVGSLTDPQSNPCQTLANPPRYPLEKHRWMRHSWTPSTLGPLSYLAQLDPYTETDFLNHSYIVLNFVRKTKRCTNTTGTFLCFSVKVQNYVGLILKVGV